MRFNALKLSTLLTLFLTLAEYSHGQMCSQVFRPWGKTATEIELNLDSSTMPLLEPKDSTGLNFPKMRFMDRLKWFKQSAERETNDWFENKKSTEIKTTDDFFEPYVEYLSTTDRANFSAFEIHAVTSDVPAGTHVVRTWEHLEKRKIARPDLQSHFTRRWIHNPNSFVEAFGLIDYWRRIQVIAESLTVLYGSSVTNIVENKLHVFGPLPHMKLAMAFDDVMEGNINEFRGFYKLGYVGLRDSMTYDQPGLLGLEYRAIGKRFSKKTVEHTLNRMQEDFIFGNFDWKLSEIQDLTKDLIKFETEQNRLARSLSESSYHQPLYDLAQRRASPVVKPLLTAENLKKLSRVMNEGAFESADNLQLKMLLMDWRKDVYLKKEYAHLKNAEAVFARIEKAQVDALEMFLSGDLNAVQATQKFLLESQLIHWLYPSLKLDLSEFRIPVPASRE